MKKEITYSVGTGGNSNTATKKMKATVYRYNANDRSDRMYNNCGREKNPNNVKFYARSMDYADRYRYITLSCGDIDYECTLEVTEVMTDKLFDMNSNFATLDTYKKYIDDQIGTMRRDYTEFMNNATTRADRDLFAGFIANLDSEESAIIKRLQLNEFQSLSDFDLQNDLIAELTAKGYNGYITTNEIAIFP